MGITLTQVNPSIPTANYTADERIYLDADGKICASDDPNRATLLVAKGGTITREEAVRYGLVTTDGEPVSATPPDALTVKAPEATDATESATPKTKKTARSSPSEGAGETPPGDADPNAPAGDGGTGDLNATA